MASLTRCKFWDKCYRKNPDHLKQFLHPSSAAGKAKRKASDSDSDEDLEVKKRRLSSNEEESEKDTTKLTNEDLAVKDKAKLTNGDACGKDDTKLTNGDASEEDNKQTQNDKEVHSPKTNPKPSNGTKMADISDEDSDDDFLALASPKTKDTAEEDMAENAGKRKVEETALNDGTPQELLKLKYSMDFPADLFDMWDYCCSRSPMSPLQALNEIGLLLVGPFDVLAARRRGASLPAEADLALHWRFFYDPPELTTILAVSPKAVAEDEDLEGLHYGYFRDDPKEMPAFVVSSVKTKGGVLSRAGGSCFAAAVAHCDRMTKAERRADKKKRIKDIKAELEARAKAKGHAFDGSKTLLEKAREKKVVAKPFHGVGMVVPFDKKTQVGYRDLNETNSDLKKMFTKWTEATVEKDQEKLFAPIQQILTYIQFANDECDYGMGLEMGLDLFTFGHSKFDDVVSSVLPLAYKLLDRDLFAQIAENHLKNRTDSIAPKQF